METYRAMKLLFKSCHIGYTVRKKNNMRPSDTDKLQSEYVEIYNKYMTTPDASKELKALAKNYRS